MRLVTAGLFLAAPLVAVACSSFSTTPAGSTADAGIATDATAGPVADGGAGDATEAGVDAGVSFAGDPRPVVSKAAMASAIAAHGNYVYWIAGAQSIRGVNVVDGSDTTLSILVMNPVTIGGVGVDASTLYWFERNAGAATVKVRDIRGGSASSVYSAPDTVTTFAVGPSLFVIDGAADTYTHAYASDGKPTPAVVHHACSHLIATDVSIDCVLGDVLYETVYGDTANEPALARNLDSPSALVSDGANIYALGSSTVVKVPRSSRNVDDNVVGALERVATFPAGAALMVRDGADLVLWSEKDTTLALVSLVGQQKRILRTDIDGMTSLAVSTAGIFWTTLDGDAMWVPR